MPTKPAAEVTIDAELVRRLLASQAGSVVPDAASAVVEKVAEGWDSEVWRIGRDLAMRLPRRAVAAPLVRNEQRALPGIAARIEPTGVRVPTPVVDGVPGAGYPWSWSIVPWIEGARGVDVARSERSGWAVALAAALRALHVPAPEGYPANPFRGVALAARSGAVDERLDLLRVAGAITAREADAAAAVWAEGLRAAPSAGPPVWIHGDLHPANLVAQGRRLVGIIDFGDVTAGDPAYDLAIAWLAFDEHGRREFIAATGRCEDAVWVRARAWSVAVASMLLTHSDDEPAYAALGREALAEATSPPH